MGKEFNDWTAELPGYKFPAVPVTVCSYVNRGQRRGITGEYHATQAQTNEMAPKKRLLRRLSTTGNSNLPIALSEVFPRFRRFVNSNRTSSMGELPIRCQLKRPYFTLPGYFSPADISKRESNTICTDGA